jgi:MinD-like ATPase involved in chromosome partitioning or flagellar assembly
MSTIISVHSFRGGTGKSNTTANIAAILAGEGRRVGVIDTDIQSPGIHVLFGLKAERMTRSLNDYLWGNCGIHEAALDVTPEIDGKSTGRIFLIPSSMNPNDIARVLRERYSVRLLHEGIRNLVIELKLDVLIIDTHPGLNEETLLSIAMSNALLIVMRPDEQDYEGTSVTVQIARKLKVPKVLMVVNKTPDIFNFAEVKEHVETTYQCHVAAVIPHSDDLMILSSKGIFALRYPSHAVTALYKQIAASLIE